MLPRRSLGTAAALLLLASALVGAAGAGAARQQWGHMQGAAGDKGSTLQWLTSSLLRSDDPEADKKRHDDDESCAIVAFKYHVMPSLHDKFIEQWQKLEDRTRDEKHMVMYDLSKTFADDVYFWTYGEWESMKDFYNHFTSDATREFKGWLNDNDVQWEMFPLNNVTDNSFSARTKGDAGKGKGKGEDPRDLAAHIVIQYHVPPSIADEFKGVWSDCAEKTWDEEDNHIYALRKFSTMNHHFIAYGSWKSFDAYMDHWMAKHTTKLREWLRDNDVMWYMDTVYHYSKRD
ncbi:hypothetical protein HYH03_011856 [Edaphochlamys debaryana]|uniref:ABM domain-containing protein n=1 Tax=Edaphochlamys debaryana TaxID=47281 RepID=A0A835XU18_9CHLO|nr:hypothetical protein HYH03_011856 [Edaphochlamys debaryana]|eukprot:KAG2489749.1 hypothetical protein HYH03_011856 [Edaphochlamys debaryana]